MTARTVPARFPLRATPRRRRAVSWLALLAWCLLNAAPVVSQCLYALAAPAVHVDWCESHATTPSPLPAAEHGSGMLCGYCELLCHSPLYTVALVLTALPGPAALAPPRWRVWQPPPAPRRRHLLPRGPPTPDTL